MINRTTLITSTLIAAIGAFGLASATVQAQDIEDYPDQSAIILQGTVDETSDDEFTLDYGDGEIIVEMEDWDFYTNEAEALIPGERVTVTGYIDDDLFEGREIEADTVYVQDRYTYYYLEDEPDPYYYSYVFMDYDVADDTELGDTLVRNASEGAWVSATGTVQDIEGLEMTLNTGTGEVEVNTVALGYNPFDETGFKQIKRGDRVYVSGILDDEFFDQKEIEASSIVRLQQDVGRED